MVTRRRARHAEGGFTLLEVMIALLIGMIGLMGSVAIQMTVLRGAKNSNDAMVAMRLATQQMEKFTVANCLAVDDELATLSNGGNWSGDEWVDSNDRCGASVFSLSPTPACRFKRKWRIQNTGVGSPYNLSVTVSYNLDGSNLAEKVIRVDVQRAKLH